MRTVPIITSIIILLLIPACGRGGSTAIPTPQPSPEIERRVLGFDVYLAGNPSKDCKWLDAYHETSILAMTLLWLPEGRSDGCLKQFLWDTRPTVIQLFMSNGVCERKGNCTEAEKAQLKDAMYDNTIDALRFLKRENRGPIEIQIFATLEDNLQYAQARDVCLNLKAAVSGEAQVWRNPVLAARHDFSDECFDGVRLHNKEEFPTDYRGACSWSNDGLDIDFPTGQTWSLPNRISTAELLSEGKRRGERGCDVYLWSADFSNCLGGDTAGAPPTSYRDCSLSNRNTHLMTQIRKEIEDAFRTEEERRA